MNDGKIIEALEQIASGEAFQQQRFAEDDDADYFLRCQRAIMDLARDALTNKGPDAGGGEGEVTPEQIYDAMPKRGQEAYSLSQIRMFLEAQQKARASSPKLKEETGEAGDVERLADIERDIRISIWNGARWQGSPQEVAQSLIRKIMDEPTMKRALETVRQLLSALPDREVRSQDQGVTPSGPGCEATPSAAVPASSQSRIPNAEGGR